MEFYVLYGNAWENIKAFKSGRKARAFFQRINQTGEDGVLFCHRPGRPCLAWDALAYTDAYKKKYR